MIVRSDPEKTLLKPRATMLLPERLVWKMSSPGCTWTWSAGVTEIVRPISADETEETDAGASSAFSCRREAVTTRGFRISARERIGISVSVLPPASTAIPSTRVVSYPISVMITEWVPTGTGKENPPPASVAPSDSPTISTVAPAIAVPSSASVTRPESVPSCPWRGVAARPRERERIVSQG